MTKAIILAAGQGLRLKPLTNDRPKGMVKVAGLPIIEHQLRLFRRVGIQDVVVIDGFCRQSIPDYGVRHYTNEEYATTNMVYSLFCADKELASDDVLVSYGDIVYSERVLRGLLKSRAPVSVVVDLDWKAYFAERFRNPYSDAESLVVDKGGLITNIGQKRPHPDQVQAQYIGLTKFDGAGLASIRKVRDDVATREGVIGWGRTWRAAYMTDLLQELVERNVSVRAVRIHGDWCEVDSLRDHELATRRVTGMLELDSGGLDE